MDGVQWVGSDGNRWVRDSKGTRNLGKATAEGGNYWVNQGYRMILDPVQDYGKQFATSGNWASATGNSPYSGGAGTPAGTWATNNPGGSVLGDSTSLSTAEAAPVDPDAGTRAQLRGEISAKGGEIDSLYGSLFGDIDNLVRSRDTELESEYGEQFKKANDQYTAAIPELENSYAAIGAGDSTDNSDAKDKAKGGHEETVKTIGKNKSDDKAKLGAYKAEQTAKITADRDNAKRNVERAGSTEDVGALRQMRNDIETNISNAGVTKATLGTNGAARQQVSQLTGDAGRFDQAINSLDSIIKSSMSGAVKEAAVKAIKDNAGLSDEEKKKVDQQFGNVYAEQQAL